MREAIKQKKSSKRTNLQRILKIKRDEYDQKIAVSLILIYFRNVGHMEDPDQSVVAQ